MPIRSTPLVNGHVYHIYSRGVNRMPIFHQTKDYQRFKNLLDYCRHADYEVKFSILNKLSQENRQKVRDSLKERFVCLIAYSLMPNHFHLVIRQNIEGGITSFLNRLLISYTKFINIKYERSGPLLDGRFKAKLIENGETLNHVVRYAHLNPYTSAIVKNYQDLLTYPWSSLSEYTKTNEGLEICDGKEIILQNFSTIEKYKQFTLDQADYQKELEAIKHFIEE